MTTAFSRKIGGESAATSCPNPISMFSLFESHFASPRTPIMVASVTMKGWIRRVAITAPFTAPAGADAARPRSAIAAGDSRARQRG